MERRGLSGSKVRSLSSVSADCASCAQSSPAGRLGAGGGGGCARRPRPGAGGTPAVQLDGLAAEVDVDMPTTTCGWRQDRRRRTTRGVESDVKVTAVTKRTDEPGTTGRWQKRRGCRRLCYTSPNHLETNHRLESDRHGKRRT